MFVLEENHYGAFSASCRNRGKAQTVNGNFVLLLVGETYKQEIIEGMTHLLLGWSSDVYINTIFTDATGGNINDRIASVQIRIVTGIYVSIGCRSNIQFVRLPVP